MAAQERRTDRGVDGVEGGKHMWNASVAEPSLTPPPALSPAASASAAHSVVAALNLVELEVLPAHKVQRPLDQPEPNDALQEGGRASREGTVVRPLPLLLPPARPAAAGKAGGLVVYAMGPHMRG